MSDREYPKEVILEYRRKLKAGDFHRKIVGHEPVDLGDDLVELSCGHKVILSTGMLELTEAAARLNKDKYLHKCLKCEQEWLQSL